MKSDAIIVGGGIIGAACAYELAKNGLKVKVFDACLRNATSSGMGHLVNMDDLEPEFNLSSWSIKIWHQLGKILPEQCAYKKIPTLWLAKDSKEVQIAQEKYTRLIEKGIECKLLDSSELYIEAPYLRPGLLGALQVFDDGIVYAPCVAEWFLRQYPDLIEIEYKKVTHILDYKVCLEDGESHDAEFIIVANGIDVNNFFPELCIEPKKGHLAITDRYPEIQLNNTLVSLAYAANAHLTSGTTVACNIQPRPTGQIFLGSSRQFDTTDPTIDMNILAEVIRENLEYFPGLEDLNIIRAWTGFRAATQDGIPIIGPHPKFKSIYLAVGHEGLGVTTATGTAKLISSYICKTEAGIDGTPFLPNRIFNGDQRL